MASEPVTANAPTGTRKGEVQKDVIGLAISRLASRRPDDNEPWYLRMMHRLFVSKPHPLARQMLILRGQLNDLAFSAPLGSIP